MSIQVQSTPLSGVLIIELKVHGDSRGFFLERFNLEHFRKEGLPTEFVQDNHSRSSPGVLRGLHYQLNPSQGKLVGVVRGKIWDVVVDIRPQSLTFGKSFGIELNDVNGTLLWIPSGFAHGFCVLGNEPGDVIYKVDQLYNPSCESGLLWNDPDLNIQWPIERPILSAKDQLLPSFKQSFLEPLHRN